MAEENAALALQSHLLSRGNRTQAVLDELQRTLGLPEPPHRIEAFDVSTFQGGETVASMVVWQDGEMKKDDYKRYRIRTVTGTDDFAAMHEAVSPALLDGLETEGVLPDLILLDGGRGQLGAGIKALEALGLDYLPMASLAKRAEEVFTPDRLEPLVLDLTSPALQALQRIRDEAHRFAITYHKKLRSRRTISSVLDQIPGVRPASHESPQDAGLGPRPCASLRQLAAGPGLPNWPSASTTLFNPLSREEPSGTEPG
jgi:excinuclease ABC subunit C